jgi:diguanylate cyclase (GGDEF)-like protein/putative nucleotidyltransferase with HDIG domain
LKDLSVRSRVFIYATILTGLGLMMWQLPRLSFSSVWLPILAGLAAVAQVLKVEGATNRSSYNLSWTIYGFTFVLLGTPATLFVILIAHLIEWAWHRYSWYIQLFNIAAFSIATAGAYLVYTAINPTLEPFRLTGTLGVLAALIVFTLLNHLLVGLVIWAARGENFSRSGVFDPLCLIIDFTLMGMGTASALIWMINPSAAILNTIPLYLIYSTLRVPALQRQAEIDPKTGLFNAPYFADALTKELARAERFNRPLSVVLGDLDLLRNINNTYGHVAGDVVLVEIAKILQNAVRDYDIVARFGGEEFAILMPEVTPKEALPRVEELRQAIAAKGFEITTSVVPIRATMSFGISGWDGDDLDATDLIHNADMALYHAKLNGRNLTSIYSDEKTSAIVAASQSEEISQHNFKARLDLATQPFQPNPLRERATARPSQPLSGDTSPIKPRPRRWLYGFIAALITAAGGLIWLTARPADSMDWLGLLTIALIVLLTEGLAIELQVGNSTISTSAAPLIAGVFLFGPVAALTLSLILAMTSLIRNRSQLIRFIFNLCNHLIATSLVVALLQALPTPYLAQPALVQFSLVIFATAIIYTLSTGLISIVIDISTGQPFIEVWRSRYRWLAPYYMAMGIVAYALVLSYYGIGLQGVLLILVPLWMLRLSQLQYMRHTKSLVSRLAAINTELEGKTLEINTLNDDLLDILAHAIDLSSCDSPGHSTNVARYAVLIAESLGLPEYRVALIHKAALLHDIGKLALDDQSLKKAGKLTSEEYTAIMTHPALGAELVTNSRNLRLVAPIIRHHHEHFDGSGYPDGLQGQEIPIEARILNVVEALDTMITDQPYRAALEMDEVLKEITENAGSQFDPLVVETLIQILQAEKKSLTNGSTMQVRGSQPLEI